MYGQDATNPVIIYLHGRPAVPNKEEVQKSWVDGQMNIFDYLNCREG